MSNSVTYNQEDGFIRMELQGKVDKALVKELASQTARIARKYECYLVLNDAREATSGLSTLEIFDLPRIIVEILTETGLEVHKFKRVLVVSKDVDDFTFFETVSQNRGQKVTLFRNFDEARSWLLGK
jgi:hypothetical protein